MAQIGLLFVTEKHYSRLLFALLLFLSLLLHFFFRQPSCLGWYFICQCDVLRGSDTRCFEKSSKTRLLLQLCLLLVCHKYAQRVRPFYAPKVGLKTAKVKVMHNSSITQRQTMEDYIIFNKALHSLTTQSIWWQRHLHNLLDARVHVAPTSPPRRSLPEIEIHLQFARRSRCCNRSKENNVTALTASFINRGLVTSTVCCCTRSCGTNLITSMWSQPAQRQRNIHSQRRDSVLMWSTSSMIEGTKIYNLCVGIRNLHADPLHIHVVHQHFFRIACSAPGQMSLPVAGAFEQSKLASQISHFQVDNRLRVSQRVHTLCFLSFLGVAPP